jgi:competence protein ComEC
VNWSRKSAQQGSQARVLPSARAVWPLLNDLNLDVLLTQVWANEVSERRLFLWLPVAAGAGVLLYLNADSEPVVWFPALILSLVLGGAYIFRARPIAFNVMMLVGAILFGFICGEARRWHMDAPVLDRPRILHLSGVVEEVDMQPHGARFILHIVQATDMAGQTLAPEICPTHVRLSLREGAHLVAGDTIRILARLLPPAHASIPGGYDFSRAAYFSGLGGVGSVLGRIEAMPPMDITWSDRILFALDRSRNLLAERVNTIIGGQEGAIAAAMVTGKRTLLTEDALDVIRQAGIFHIITISGVQMTLVAGMVFWFSRRLMAFSTDLALGYPIKKIAACIAIAAALFYDFGTGSRVGTERALVMTLIMLGAILFDRQAFTMRNLGFSVLAVIVLEPEAIAGASFQLSFAAVAALIAVQEARYRALALAKQEASQIPRQTHHESFFTHLTEWGTGLRQLIVSTFCATTATASFMAADFHDLSPYVLIGNPLTLAVIEFFAVPGALIGTLLYPFGLDSIVWTYVGAGIRLVLWVARLIGSAPGSTLHLHAFAPWALPFLTLAVLNMVIWRSWLLRALAIPCALIGIAGAYIGAPFDIVIPPTGESLAMRQPDGTLAIIGRRPSVFAATQWLAADGDGRSVAQAMSLRQSCDAFACVERVQNRPIVSVVNNVIAFEEDCQRADIIISNLKAPFGCAAKWIFDSSKLAALGAVTLSYSQPGNALTSSSMNFVLESERTPLTDRPWSRPLDSRRSLFVRSAIDRKSHLKKTAFASQDSETDSTNTTKPQLSNPVSAQAPDNEDMLSIVDDDLLP